MILKGVEIKDHVYMSIEYPLMLSISILGKRLKGFTSLMLQ
jgi:REP element-mobilizing transposase RayT